MDPLTIIAASVSLSRQLLEMVERYANGDMTPEELRAEWQAMRGRLQQANDLWEAGE